MNKRLELESLINQQDYKPDIIGIVEVKAKNPKETPLIAEFALNGYDMHCMNVDEAHGRGIILYTALWLNATSYTMESTALESVWITVKLTDADSIIIGCIYRSPSSTFTNNVCLNNQLRKACTSGVATHVLIMGDFNYPIINWNTGNSSLPTSESLFMDTINDSYLYQHVTCPTRVKPNQCPNVLDLIFTNEDGMLSDLEVLAPLGKSDHTVLLFNLNCYIEAESVTEQRRNYNKGDYNRLRNELLIDWGLLLDPLHNNAEAQFTVLHQLLDEACEKCIPYVTINPAVKNRPPMDKDIRKLNRRKRRLWNRYIETRDINKYHDYCKCRNKVRAATRRARKEFELQIALKADTEPKMFWKYANSKLKTRSKIPDLYKNTDKNRLTTSDVEKVEALSSFFWKCLYYKDNR